MEDVQPFELGDVVRSALDGARSAADAKQIALLTEIDPVATALAGDAGRLQQVVCELIENAVKSTPSGGSVAVVVRRRGTNVEIVVRDDGRGIAAAQLPYVFDRVRQHEPASGLATVKSLVEQHGGTVTAHSAGEDAGSTFTVRLPTMAEVPVVAESSSSVGRNRIRVPDNLRGLRVLVVDDDRDATDLLAELLGGYGVTPIVASSAAQAMEALERERPDALVSDIGMPGEDGYSLIGRIRKLSDPALSAIPAMAVTAFARTEDCAKALWSGFNHHLPKPVDPNELFAVLGTMTAARPRV